jgi:hypothetical protein
METMETRVTLQGEPNTVVNFIVDNLSISDLRSITRDIIGSSITAIKTNDITELRNSLQMAVTKAEASTIIQSNLPALPINPAGDLEANRVNEYFKQREQALRLIAEFEHRKTEFIDRYAGCYVAYYNGDVVDNDMSRETLAKRFYERYGNVPVCISKVGDEQEVIHIVTPFFPGR